mgnify:CR=1 FL=1
MNKELQNVTTENTAEDKIREPESVNILDLFDEALYMSGDKSEDAMIKGIAHGALCLSHLEECTRYTMSRKITSLLETGSYSVKTLLTRYKLTIDELIYICECSVAARTEIARQGYGLDILALDPSDTVKMEVIKKGYWCENMRLSPEVAMEAISRGMALYQIAISIFNPLKVRVAAICKLLELHSHSIYKIAVIEHYNMELNFEEIGGIYYTLGKKECLELICIAIELKDVLSIAINEHGLRDLIYYTSWK